tara:strand:+ start:9163 stop:10170 length:1008 start_codon:yes stop_codon:yes gene_type:complete
MVKKCLIIAEAGVNHNGILNNAKKLIRIAADAKADFIKFQIFNTKYLVRVNAPKAKYQINNSNIKESHFNMLKRLELKESDFEKLIRYSRKLKINFLASVFSHDSLKIIKKNKINYIKIPSGEITNAPLLKEIGKLKKIIFLSTGMSDLKDIKDALSILITAGTSKSKIYVMQCNTEYPTPLRDINLNAMLTIKKEFNTKIGFSDHSIGKEAGGAAVSLGAEVIEKHITIDKKMSGPDHIASMNKVEFVDYVKSIRKTEMILGSFKKRVSPSERKNIRIARRSIYASRVICTGEVIKRSDLVMLRPNVGLSPMEIKKVVGKKAKRNFKKYDLISI